MNFIWIISIWLSAVITFIGFSQLFDTMTFLHLNYLYNRESNEKTNKFTNPITNQINNQFTNPITNQIIKTLSQYKVQILRQPIDISFTEHIKFLTNEWWMAFNVTAFNLFIVLPFILPFFIYIMEYVGVQDFDSPFVLSIEMLKMFGFAICTELWFYLTHRILHMKYFYIYIHKFHHHFVTPFAISGFYTNPIEFVFGNLISGAIGPIIFSSHIITFLIYIIVSQFYVSLTHSGFEFNRLLSAEFHDLHHRKPHVNFGVFGILDTLFNTMYCIDHKKMY